MAKIEMATQFYYSIKIPDEDLEKIQQQYYPQEMVKRICLTINEYLAKYFKDENTTGICDINSNTAVLAIAGTVVF